MMASAHKRAPWEERPKVHSRLFGLTAELTNQAASWLSSAAFTRQKEYLEILNRVRARKTGGLVGDTS